MVSGFYSSIKSIILKVDSEALQQLKQLKKLVLHVFVMDVPALEMFQNWHKSITLQEIELWTFVSYDDCGILLADSDWQYQNSTYKALSTKKRFPALFKIIVGLLHSGQGHETPISQMASLQDVMTKQSKEGMAGNDSIMCWIGWDMTYNISSTLQKEGEKRNWKNDHIYKERYIYEKEDLRDFFMTDQNDLESAAYAKLIRNLNLNGVE